jgi:hypothetical protein
MFQGLDRNRVDELGIGLDLSLALEKFSLVLLLSLGFR